jgi:two-component system sensor histidine kinase YesM
LLKLGGRLTLRKQIFIGFMFAMVIVLSSVGAFVYNQVSEMLMNNAERHIQQTAAQAIGKLEVLLDQVRMITTQTVTNAVVQEFFKQELDGFPLSFDERQLLQQEVRNIEAYTKGIRSIELYTSDYRRLTPLTDDPLHERVPEEWLQQVDAARGGLVWLGADPRNPDMMIAMRQVRLMDWSYVQSGYILVQIERRYFDLTDRSGEDDGNRQTKEYMALLDEQGEVITADFPAGLDISRELKDQDEIAIDGEPYLAVRQHSPATHWSVVILTPVSFTTEGLSVLRTVVVVSVVVGGAIFLIVAYILSGMLSRPILDLIKAMRNVRFGSLRPITVQSRMMEINELNYTYNAMVRSLNELNEIVYQKELIRSRTELKALQAQINPHFLFNTLEAFYWALEEKGEEELAHIVVAMSGLFRYVISREDEDVWVTVGDELDHAERYLTIMGMRLMDRLQWRIEAAEYTRSVRIPKLLIQPLVENAVMHGVEQRIEPGTVVVRATLDESGDYTRIEVSDDGPGMDEQTLRRLRDLKDSGPPPSGKGTGLGMANVEQRLRLYYKNQTEGLKIHSRPGQGTCVSFLIPNQGSG